MEHLLKYAVCGRQYVLSSRRLQTAYRLLEWRIVSGIHEDSLDLRDDLAVDL